MLNVVKGFIFEDVYIEKTVVLKKILDIENTTFKKKNNELLNLGFIEWVE